MKRCLASLVIMQMLIKTLNVLLFHAPETGGKRRRCGDIKGGCYRDSRDPHARPREASISALTSYRAGDVSLRSGHFTPAFTP